MLSAGRVAATTAGPATPDAPCIVVVNHDHGWNAVLGQRFDLHAGIGEARVARNRQYRRTLVRGLRTDALLDSGTDPDRVTDIGSNGSVLVGAVADLARSKRSDATARVPSYSVASRNHGRLVLGQLAVVEQILDLLGDHCGMHG